MKFWKHNHDPTRNEQSWFWSKSGRFFAYLIVFFGTILTFLLANVLTNALQTLLVGILDENNGLMSGNGFQTAYNFVLNNLWNWNTLLFNNELLRSIYLGGTTFFQNHGSFISSLFKWGIFIFLFWHYDFYYLMRIYNRSSKLNHNEHGDDRIATPHEVSQETFKVPDRKYGYKFPSGVLIMHKMNLRGRINEFVKQQMLPTQKALQLHTDEDWWFRTIETLVFALIVILMGIGTFLDYGKATSSIPLYSPIRLFRGIRDVVSFIRKDIIINLWMMIKDLQSYIFHAPFYASAPLIALEAVGIIYIVVHSYNHFTHANMLDQVLSSVDYKAARDKRSMKHHENSKYRKELKHNPHFKAIMKKLRTQKRKKFCKELKNYYHYFFSKKHLKDLHYSFTSLCHKSYVLYIESKKYSKNKYKTFVHKAKEAKHDPHLVRNIRDDIKRHQDIKQNESDVHKDKISTPFDLVNNHMTSKQSHYYATHKETNNIVLQHSKRPAVLRALYKIGMHPFKSSEYMYLLALNCLPLNHGITGYYYINPKLMNTILFGMTRSGKGQMEVNTTIENNSRTKKQKKNMLINDSKGELSAGFYKTLKKRGYRVEVLNVIQMLHSMSYNPLNLVKRHAMQGDIGQAAKACSDLSYTIYLSSNHGQNQYFYDSAANVFDASVFALLALANSEVYGKYDSNLKISDTVDSHAFDKVTIANVVQMTTQLGGTQTTEVGSEQSDLKSTSNQLILFFQHLSQQVENLRDLRASRKQKHPDKFSNTNINPLTNLEADQLNLLDQSLQKFNQSKMAGSEASGSIYSTFVEGLRIYQQPDVAKMTSMNSVNVEELGFDRLLTIQFNRAFNQQRLKLDIIAPIKDKNDHVHYKTIESDSSQLSTIGLSQIPIRKSIAYNHFYLRLTIQDERLDSTNNKNVFQWLLDCHKDYYGYQEVKEMKDNPRESPRVADIDLDDNKKSALDHYTHKKVFKRIHMKVISSPAKYNFTEEAIGKSPLNTIALNNEASLREDQLKFLYREQPTALFLVTPPDQQELNELCTFLINQTFNTLYSLASTITNDRKVQRPLQMILDEVGNIPAIPRLNTKASIGLSAGVEMMLVFQDRKQIDKIYGKDIASIVIANCATLMYILSNDDSTTKEISGAFGQRTIKSSQLTTNPNGLSGTSKNYNLIKQDVMPVGRLKHLNVGEMAIVRATDRSNVWGKNSRPNPIFDTYWGHKNLLMPYAYWFLGNEIQNDVSLSNIPIVTPHKYLDLNDLTVDFAHLYTQMEVKNTMDNNKLGKTHRKLLKDFERIPNKISRKDADQALEKAFNHASLGEMLRVKKNYGQQNQNGRGAASLVQFGNIVNQMRHNHRVTEILHEADINSSINIDDLSDLTKGVFKKTDTFNIDYEHLNKNNVHKLLHMIDYIKALYKSNINDKTLNAMNRVSSYAIEQINSDFNLYLLNQHLINPIHDGYQLTPRGKDFLDNALAYMHTYTKKIIGVNDNRDAIQDFLTTIIQILSAFYYRSDYEKYISKDDLNHLRYWTGLLIFQQFVHTFNLDHLLTDQNGEINTNIGTYQVLQSILGIFDNMYVCYLAQNNSKLEAQYRETRKITSNFSKLLNQIIDINKFVSNQFPNT